MSKQFLNLSEINEGSRTRRDYGNVEELAESIRDEGLLQPIVIKRDGTLIAGGRRLRAFQLLASGEVKSAQPSFYETVPVRVFEDYLVKAGILKKGEEITESRLRRLELEENVQRKSMDWIERIFSIYEYHRTSQIDAASEGDSWSQSQTGKLLNQSQAWVSQALAIAKELRADKEQKSPLWKLDSLSDAIRYKVSERAQEAATLLMERNKTKTLSAASSPELAAGADQFALLVEKAKTLSAAATQQTSGEAEGDQPRTLNRVPVEMFKYEDIARMFHIENALEFLPRLAKSTTINHIITDPPYAIDMANLDTFEGIENVEKEHQVEENKDLLSEFLKVAYDCINESGFMCMWYDLSMHQDLLDRAAKVGWIVCRWPFHWVKTSPCRNSQGMYNFTKAVEHCLIMRRSTKSILAQKGPNNFVLADSERNASHPFYKPSEVWAPLINAVSKEGETIVDPFCGEGSMLVPGVRLKRVPFGCDMVEQHVVNGIARTHSKLNALSFTPSPSSLVEGSKDLSSLF